MMGNLGSEVRLGSETLSEDTTSATGLTLGLPSDTGM
jgi:hypothetical protein